MGENPCAGKPAEQDSRLNQGEAFDLYVRGISRNLASLLEQLVLLRGLVAVTDASPDPHPQGSTDQSTLETSVDR